MSNLSTAQRLSTYYDELVAAGFNGEAASEMVKQAAPRTMDDIELQSELDAKPIRSPYAIAAVMFDKRVVIDWPDGPPPGVSRQDLKETLEGYALALIDHMATKDSHEPGANS